MPGTLTVNIDESLTDLIPGFLERKRADILSMIEASSRHDYATIARGCLFVLPLRLAFLDERRGALNAVRAAEHHPECLLLEAQPGVFFHRERRAQRRFRLSKRECRFGRDFFRELARRVH